MNTILTQNKSHQSDTPSAPRVWIGLDWADRKHYGLVLPPGADNPLGHFIEQTPEALDEFFLKLRQQYPGERLGVCIEQSRGPVIYALMKYDFLVIYPINPRSLSDYRRVFAVSGAKSDPHDAALLCDLGAKHHRRLRPLQPEDALTRQLRLEVEARRDFVDQRTRLSNQLIATLKCYYPLFLTLFRENLWSQMAAEFLRRWPNLAKLQAAKPSVLRAFFYKHNSRSETKIEARLQAIATARALTNDPAIIAPLQLKALCLVRQIGAVQKTIEEFDEQIRISFEEHTNAPLFKSLPGAGPALAPRLAAAFGTQRSNWQSALDLLCLTGIAPVKKESGQQRVVQFRRARPRFLHQTMIEFAKHSIPYCDWARLLYEHHLSKGKSKFAAIRAVAFKWIRILWRCWKENTAYNEATYLESLRRSGVKLYESLYSSPPVTCVTKSE